MIAAWLRIACLVLAALALPLSPALAGKKDDTLTAGFRLQLQSLDSLFSPGREGLLLTFWLYDNFLYRDPVSLEFKPLLATSWKQIDDVTLELTMREGVKFHDGSVMTPDDAVYTLNFVGDIANNVFNQSIVSWVKRAEKTADGKVRVISKQPTPLALEYLSKIAVYPKPYYERVGKEGMATAPIGTGPYTAKPGPSNTVVFTRNDNYFEGGPKPRPAIKTLIYKTVPEVNTQVAELLTGALDWAFYIPDDQATKLASARNLRVVNEETFRIAYLTMDPAGRTNPATPLKNLKVREAISYAIDREALAKNLVGGKTRVIHSICFPTQFGCTDQVRRFTYDVAKAKALMAEAGTGGFEVDLYAFRSRQVAEAIVGYLGAIGIKANMRWLQYPAVVQKRRSSEAPMIVDDWGSTSINDAAAMVSVFFRGGPDDYTNDPVIQKALETADNTLDAAVRKKGYGEVMQRIAEQAYWLPLFTMPVNYVLGADLDMPVSTDEVPEFYRAKWK